MLIPRSSVVPSPHKPALPQCVVINSIQPIARARIRTPFILRGRKIQSHIHVPFVLLPRIFAPPIAGSSPRPRSGGDVAAHSAKNNARRTCLTQLHLRWPFRSKNFGMQSPSVEIAVHDFLRSYSPLLRPVLFFAALLSLPAPEQISPSEKFPAGANPPIPVTQYSRRPPNWPAAPPSIPIFPDQELWDEIIHLAPSSCPRATSHQRNFQYGRVRRIGLQLQPHQLQKCFGIPHSHGQTQNLFVNLERNFFRGFFAPNLHLLPKKIPQIKSQMNRRRSQRTRL